MIKEMTLERSESRDGTKVMIKKIGVIGAGQMGNGIAHVCSLAGYGVLMYDVAPDAVDTAIKKIEGNMQRQVSRGMIKDADRAAALKLIGRAGSMADFGDCDLVIEAAVENEEVKRNDLQGALSASEAVRHHRLQHLLDLDHPPRLYDRPAREIHRDAFHESRCP